MAFSTGNCKMQHCRGMFIDAMYRYKQNIEFLETSCTIYLCSYQKRLFPALLKKGCLKYRKNCEVYKKQVDICSKNCVLLAVCFTKLLECVKKDNIRFLNNVFNNFKHSISYWNFIITWAKKCLANISPYE